VRGLLDFNSVKAKEYLTLVLLFPAKTG
jgi:hypothetical protein